MHAEPPTTGAGRTVVVIPTYNESLTLPTTLGRLRAAVPGADVLIVDDGSPDGTGAIADAAEAADVAVHVLHRSGKQGLGSAYVAGFRWALEHGYDVVCEMDADGSHRPEEMPRLLDGLVDGVDLVIGSRWVPGGAVQNWPRSRQLLSRGGNTYTRVMLDLGVADATAGFRAFRADTLRAIDLASVASQGYCFQVDMTKRVRESGGEVREVPITFVEREAGESKMSRSIVTEALWRVTVWGVQKRSRQLQGLLRRR